MSAALAHRIDAIFAPWLGPDWPGCIVGIVQDGDLVYERGFGRASLEHDLPITGTTVFDIASTSKQFTAACIALLIESGRLTLDADIRTHMPELPDFGHAVTVGHLLYHTSGWRDYLTLFELAGYREADFFDEAEVVAMLCRQRSLNFTPGERYDYSNTGFYLLGALVTRVTGQSLASFAHDHIFAPLEMSRTWFQDDHTRIVPGRAVGYSPNAAGGFRTDMTTLDIVGDGAVMTCLHDLLLWDRNFYDNRLGQCSQTLIDLMTAPGQLHNGQSTDYGFGLDLAPYRGLPCVSHSGWFVGYRSEMMRFPEQRFTVICLANSSGINPRNLCFQVADVWLHGVLGPAPEPTTPDATAQHLADMDESWPAAGTYFDAASHRVMVVSEAAGQRCVDFGAGPRPLEMAGPDRWRTADASYDIAPDGSRLTVALFGHPYADCEPIGPYTPAATDLRRLAGVYYNPELDVYYELLHEGGGLWLRHGRVAPVKTDPVREDVFRLGNRTLVFASDDSNEVTGFTLSADRAGGFRFGRETATSSTGA